MEFDISHINDLEELEELVAPFAGDDIQKGHH